MATHAGILAWKIPWTEEPGGVQSMKLQRVRHDWAAEHIYTKRGTPGNKGTSGFPTSQQRELRNKGFPLAKYSRGYGWRSSFHSMSVSHSVVSGSLRSHGLQPIRLLCPWTSPGKNTGVGSQWVIISVQFSHSVVSNSLWPHGLQHARLPCPSPTPRACSNSCPLSQWCHPTISFSVILLSSCFQSFPASGSFPNESVFHIRWQSIRASASVLPLNILDWFPLKWTGLISLQSKGLLRVFSNTTVQRHQFFGAQLSLSSNSHIHT